MMLFLEIAAPVEWKPVRQERCSVMLRHIPERFQSRSKGLAYRIDPAIATSDLFGLVARQSTALGRGMLRRRGLVFIERGVILRSPGRISIGRFSRIGAGCLIEGLSRDGITIGRGVSLGRGGRIRATATLTELGAGVTIGDHVGLGDGFYLGAFGGIEIGSGTIVGERLTVHSDNHDFDDPTRSIREQGTTALPVRIGARCWMGSNVAVLGGVEIGPDCVVGAGAVITKSFPAGSVIAGNPARLLRSRFRDSAPAIVATEQTNDTSEGHIS